MELPGWLRHHKRYKLDITPQPEGGESDASGDFDPEKPVDDDTATVITSAAFTSKDVSLHRPLLDLDMEATLIPSSTPGHYHLYIDKIIPDKDYEKLITVLVEVGILQQGIMNQFKRRGQTTLRLPHIRKEIAK